MKRVRIRKSKRTKKREKERRAIDEHREKEERATPRSIYGRVRETL